MSVSDLVAIDVEASDTEFDVAKTLVRMQPQVKLQKLTNTAPKPSPSAMLTTAQYEEQQRSSESHSSDREDKDKFPDQEQPAQDDLWEDVAIVDT